MSTMDPTTSAATATNLLSRALSLAAGYGQFVDEALRVQAQHHPAAHASGTPRTMRHCLPKR
jgi:hypothetical protein